MGNVWSIGSRSHHPHFVRLAWFRLPSSRGRAASAGRRSASRG
jgi:hypothetical protein